MDKLKERVLNLFLRPVLDVKLTKEESARGGKTFTLHCNSGSARSAKAFQNKGKRESRRYIA